MKHGISALSIIPVRQSGSHRSEQVTQLLFGETYEVLLSKNKWLQIKCSLDGYEGWIDENQYTEITKKEFDSIQLETIGIALDLLCSVTSSTNSIAVVTGSSLPDFDGINFKIGKEKFIYNGQALQSNQIRSMNMLEKIALRFLNAPYLWGGRSPLGIDCSGFTQIVFKCLNYSLKRDAYQQAEMGKVVNFVEETQIGDLAFFNNDEGKIIHVGIILKDQKIIHASGRVRIDNIDHFGIFNVETKKYSHQLKIIKRIL